MKRRDKHNYYLDIAQTVLKGHLFAPQLRGHYSKNDEIISTGYTGALRHRKLH